jgi:hypothetical protein
MKIGKERKKHVVSPQAPKEFIYLYHRCPECEDEAAQWDNLTFMSPREYAKLEIGYTDEGIQVWCLRHDRNVIHICLNGTEIASDTRMGNIHILKATTVMGVKQNLTNKGV